MTEIESPPQSKRGGRREGAGRKPGNDQANDIRALVEAIRFVKVGRNNYTKLDKYRDFNRTFHGTPEGQRVLAQIMDLCEGPVTSEDDLTNHALLAGRAMSRRVGLLISAWASVPPSVDEPTKETK